MFYSTGDKDRPIMDKIICKLSFPHMTKRSSEMRVPSVKTVHSHHTHKGSETLDLLGQWHIARREGSFGN
jgi:hypothetical protein